MHDDSEKRVRAYVHGKVQREGWGPLDAAIYGADRHIVDEFRASVMFARLCADDPDRTYPEHVLAHRAVRVKGCVTLAFIPQMARKFGLSDTRAQYLIEQLDQEVAVMDGLTGGE